MKTNLQLKQLSVDYKVQLVEVSTAERNLHTLHGMHLNTKGKTWLADQIMNKIVNCTRETEIDEQSLNCGRDPPPPGTLPSGNCQFPSLNRNP